MGKFQVLSGKSKRYLVVLIISTLIVLFFGFKDSGSVYYNGYNYTAGSVFSPEKYSISGLGTNYDDSVLGNNSLIKSIWGDPNELNSQVKKARRGNLFLVMAFGIISIGSLYQLWKNRDFKDFLISLR